MRLLLSLCAALALPSCVHTALAPISDPSGEPISIAIRNVPPGKEPKRSQVMAINEALLDGMTPETLVWKYLPEIEGRGTVEAGVLGPVGEATLKTGRKVWLYVPLVAMRSSAPPARVDEAVEKLAADLYPRARRAGDVYTPAQLAKPPKR